MKQTAEALLDLWQPPVDAGEPVGLIATTFTFEPDFFEANCLARFLSLETVSEGTKSIIDLIGEIELQQALQSVPVTVLADRSSAADRSTLRWDVLHCLVPTGLLHSKISILLWEKATRVLIGSANLTQAGYRSNIETVLPADLGADCILPRDVLTVIADEVESYLDLVPGLPSEAAARKRVDELLALFRDRIASSSPTTGKVRVSAAPTNSADGPLNPLNKVWKQGRPTVATHLSPYWDSGDPSALTAVRRLLNGKPAARRRQDVLTTINQFGDIYFPADLYNEGLVDEVYELPTIDKDDRPLHAKCLRLTSDDWIAVLIGSSNHTAAGFGLTPSSRRHREMNIWLGAPRASREGKALDSLLNSGKRLPMENVTLAISDEDDDTDIIQLPAFFGYCEAVKTDEQWTLRLGFDPTAPLSVEWRVSLTDGSRLLTAGEWKAEGAPSTVVRPISEKQLAMHVVVQWDDHKASWPVVVDDRQTLPPSPALESLRAHQLLNALASGKSISQATREHLEAEAVEGVDVVMLDPHKRFDSDEYLLRRGRALGHSLAQLESRLDRPAATMDVLRARLVAPLGPIFIADRLSQDSRDHTVSAAEAAFTIAELALSVGRVDWANVVQPFADREENPLSPVVEAIEQLTKIAAGLPKSPAPIQAYCTRACAHALKEASTCPA